MAEESNSDWDSISEAPKNAGTVQKLTKRLVQRSAEKCASLAKQDPGKTGK